MANRVTLEDIANHVGVSTAAVSQALSGKGALSPATRQRILQVVEELAYQPDQVAQNLARRHATQAGGKLLKRSREKHIPPPGIMVFYNITELLEVVHLEIQQREQEGFEVGQIRAMLESWTRPTKQKLYDLYSRLLSTTPRPNFSYQEPETLLDIQKARPNGPRMECVSISSSDLYDRVYGAWLGRVAGCVLGKPLQAGWSRSKIIQYLHQANSYPLVNYVPRLVPPPEGFEFKPEAEGTFQGEIHGAPYDDDTDYTLLSLLLLETYGLDFKTTDVATEWLRRIPYYCTFTSERSVYRNLVWNVHPEEAACYVNPDREFVGARTRADLYGYIAPAKPELAAALAYTDTSLSHTKNGIYSAMLMAAMLSWTFMTDDIEEIIQVGLSEIPANSRMAEAVRDVLEIRRQSDDWELAYEHLILKFGAYSPIHAINNTIWVLLALLYANGDFNRAMGIAVSCGMDTGSNAASVGSLMGLMIASSRIPAHWTQPLNNTLNTALSHFEETHISELARRTARISERTLSMTGS
jgi:ADP-ribosylglycohydrolase/transcriptional regulator with XRE-family HTH domain